MGTPARLAVQVVNYRTRSFLSTCLRTVAADLAPSQLGYEINLLDNDSGDDLRDLARTFPSCRAFAAPSNLGFGGGHNLLASKSDAPYLLILNPDVELVAPKTIERLLAAVTREERIKAAGPKLVTAEGTPQRWDHGRLHGVRAQISLRAGHSYWRETDDRQSVAWVSGAALMIEHEAFNAVGGFDENLFLYKEDEDLCLRLRRAGGLVLYEPSVVVRHQGSVVADRAAAVVRAEDYFFAKHFPNRRIRRAFDVAHHGLARLRL